MIRKRIVALLSSAGLLFSLISPAAAATPTVTLESQGWWNKTGIVIPNDTGQHIHLKATVPQDGYPIDGILAIPYTIILHNQTGATNWIRAGGWAASGEIAAFTQDTLVLGPCSDCTVSGTINVDLTKWPTGRDELRISANVPVNDEGNRQFQSTGYQICVRSCSPTYRTPPHVEARGWYTGRGYQNAKLSSGFSTVCSGCTIKVNLTKGSGGLTTILSGVYIDPDFHNGSSGIVVKQTTASYSGSVTLPPLVSGSHKLVLLASDGFDAGILTYAFIVP